MHTNSCSFFKKMVHAETKIIFLAKCKIRYGHLTIFIFCHGKIGFCTEEMLEIISGNYGA